MRGFLLIGAIVAAVPALALGATGTGRATTSYPDSIVVLGHSIPAAWNSDPQRPWLDSKENSWATGGNPRVNSVYGRILAANPRISGHNVNLARDGADVYEVTRQARRATRLRGAQRPQLIVIQVLDGDIRCDGTDAANMAPFGRQLRAVLGILSTALPDARIFLISQIGRAETFADALQLSPDARSASQGTGRCDFFNPDGTRNETRVRYVDAITLGYERRLQAACQAFVHCRYGDMHSYVDTLENLSTDFNHFSVDGQAALAATAWEQMFDFMDAVPPRSRARITTSEATTTVTLSATDDVAVSGIEYSLEAAGQTASPPYRRYVRPIQLKKGETVTWRAVDVNGNSEHAQRRSAGG